MKLTNPFQLRRPAERAPLCLVLAVGAVQFAAFSLCQDWHVAAIIAAALLLPRIMVAMVVHNHSHVAMFRGKAANRVLDLLLYLESGMMVAKFHLHHNCGHHRFYTDPARDPSPWIRKDGSTMSRLEYIARYFFTHTYHSISLGREYPVLLRRYYREQALVVAAVAILLLLNPVNALVLFLIPMTLVWLVFINFTYDDHLGLHSNDDFEASFSKTNRFLNPLIFNNGYHLAHHVKPGMHWSELPNFHLTIASRIRVPAESTLLNRVFR